MKKTLIILMLLWLSASVKAQWTSNTMVNTLVRDSIGTEEATPMQATRSDGSTYVSFFEQYNGGYELRMQLLDLNGNKLWAPEGLVISSFPQSSALFRYDLAVDRKGNAIVAFQDIRTLGNLNVMVYKIDAGGNFLWGSSGIQLIDPLSAEGMSPNIGITNANNVIIAWTADNGSAKWIAYQKITPAGTTAWTTNRRIIDSTFVNKYSRPTMVPLGTDDFVMLYAQESGTGFPPTSLMYARHFDSIGSGVWPAPVQVSSKPIPFFFFPKAVSDGKGGFFVDFNTGNALNPTQSDVYFQHLDSTGARWNATGNVACALTNTQHFTPGSRYDPVNKKYWMLLKITDLNQSMSGVYVQKSDTAGNVQLGANGAQLIAYSSTYYDPNDFTLTTDGVITIYTIGSSSLSQTLSAIKNNFSGGLSWSGNPVTICSNIAGKDDVSSGIFLNNQVVMVWTDNRNDYGIYAQSINNEGQIGVITTVDEAISNETFSVYPNPFYDAITISCENIPANEPLEVFDIYGREVYNCLLNPNQGQGSYTLSLKSGQFPAGLYFIRLGDKVTKVIKE